MYEIPPSVDKYLRISKKSRIHFPVVSEESSLGLSSTINVLPSGYPAILENSPTFGLHAGYCLDHTARQKRSFEEYQQQEEYQRTKYPKAERCVSEEVCSWPIDYHKQDTDNAESFSAVRQLQNTNNTACHAILNAHTRHSPELHSNTQPEFEPKLATSHESPNAQASRIEAHGKTSCRKNPWGPQSYSELISAAIRASASHQASLQQIYDWIVHNIPWFSDKGDYPSTKGWKNAIRHTLSIRKRFTRIVNDRSPHASLWTFSRHGYRTMAKY